MAALLLWLLSVGAFFFSSDAQELSETYRKGVDLALENLHALPKIQQHHVFLRTVSKSEHESFGVTFIYHHFLLKSTTCAKGPADPSACQLRPDRAPMDCAVCYKMHEGEIEPDPKPYIHCSPRPSLTEEKKAERLDRCNTMRYNKGSAVLLGSTGTQ